MGISRGVFCQIWGVTLPKSIMGLSDSCVTVPCRFKIPNNEEANILNCSDGGIWRKGSLTGPFVFNARTPHSNTIQGQILGDLTKKDCTTMFHSFSKNYSDVYFFRLDCSNHVKYNFGDGVIITSLPELPPPLLTAVTQVSEGAQVRLQCSLPVPCSTLPPSVTWLPRDSGQEQTQMQQSVEDGQMIMTSTLTFIASAEHHKQNISCSVSYPLTKGGSSQLSSATQSLDVLYAPRVPVATLVTSGPVSDGRAVTFTCWSDANPPVSLYTWYRADSGKLTKKGEGEMLVLQVHQNDSGVYLCEAQSPMGSQRSRPVSLEVNATTGSSESLVMIPYIICGVLLVLCIMTVAVDVYKYQSISRRLKQIELKGEQTYSDLRTCSVTADYDRLQPQKPKTMPSPDVSDYENTIALEANFKDQPLPKLT
ncbi:myelin-associated glycoprotein isoform X2 [Sander lucioperca]|uniref:myelin-associated glycoprotein isoform X2 n=1 Tax=Sander lucioperca TaxID=283035 RepID=UPI00125E60D5|nr:myelin-associated glycoprotein isoform X2 [Sander lucioperca]